MLVKTNDREFVVNFYYEDSLPLFEDLDGTEISGTVTKAAIRMVNGEVLEPVTQGVAVCNPFDNFSKEVGRKIALSRALLSFDKEDRQAFWNSYWERSPRTVGRVNTMKTYCVRSD